MMVMMVMMMMMMRRRRTGFPPSVSADCSGNMVFLNMFLSTWIFASGFKLGISVYFLLLLLRKGKAAKAPVKAYHAQPSHWVQNALFGRNIFDHGHALRPKVRGRSFPKYFGRKTCSQVYTS